MDTVNERDSELLARLIGKEETKRVYRGKLSPLFRPGKGRQCNDLLAAARELVRRSLKEELERVDALSVPEALREYLALFTSGEELDIIAVLYLDARRRVIASERFYCGLSQVAYPRAREAVRRGLAWNAAAVVVGYSHSRLRQWTSLANQVFARALTQSLASVDIRVLDLFIRFPSPSR
jgi:DNA repair protein RadC